MNISRQPVPEDSFLKTFRGGAHPERWGEYGDCFSVTVECRLSLADFVYGFYTSWLFKIERLILRLLAASPSKDMEAWGVATGTQATFAAWRVGARSPTQLLMCDRFESTRSWFRAEPKEGGTLLQFGSAVAARRGRDGTRRLGAGFHLLLKFHVLYSKLLLRAAAARAVKLANRSALKSA